MFLGLTGSGSAWSWCVAPWRKTITYPPWRRALIQSACARALCSVGERSHNVAATAASANRAKYVTICRLLLSNVRPKRRPAPPSEHDHSVDLVLPEDNLRMFDERATMPSDAEVV